MSSRIPTCTGRSRVVVLIALLTFGLCAATASAKKASTKKVTYRLQAFDLTVREVSHQDQGGATWDGEAKEVHILADKQRVLLKQRGTRSIFVPTVIQHTGFEVYRQPGGETHPCSGVHRADSFDSSVPIDLKARKRGTSSAWELPLTGSIASRNSCPFNMPIEWLSPPLLGFLQVSGFDKGERIGDKKLTISLGLINAPGKETRTASAFGFPTSQTVEFFGLMKLKRV